MKECPDGGTCHHECKAPGCFRVSTCGPLFGVYPGDEWPADVREQHAHVALAEPMTPRREAEVRLINERLTAGAAAEALDDCLTTIDWLRARSGPTSITAGKLKALVRTYKHDTAVPASRGQALEAERQVNEAIDVAFAEIDALRAVATAAIPFAVREAQPWCCGLEACHAESASRRLLHPPCARCVLRSALAWLNALGGKT